MFYQLHSLRQQLQRAPGNGWEENKGLTIDRRNNDGNYEPDNCRWVVDSIQRRNKSTNKKISVFGEEKCLSEWEEDERCIVTASTVGKRLIRGWDAFRAISTPARKNK